MSRRVMEEAPPPAAERVSYGSDPNQFVEFRYPPNGTFVPLAVFIHGGFWRAKFGLTYAGYICQALTAAGWITANLEYRRAGQDGGGWPGTFDDIRFALWRSRVDIGLIRPASYWAIPRADIWHCELPARLRA